MADVDDASGKTCIAELSEIGPITYLHTDVAVAASTDACAQAAVDTYGHIDILVNNAALYGDWNLADQSEEYLRRVFDVNLHGVWLMTRAVAPHMVQQQYGRVINQASAAAYNYMGNIGSDEFTGLNAFNYQQTKRGVIGLTKFSAGQLGRYGITVNCLAPGRDRHRSDPQRRPRDGHRATGETAGRPRGAARRGPHRRRGLLRERGGPLRHRAGARDRRRQVHAGMSGL